MLLKLSGEIVDLSEQMDEADARSDARTIHSCVQRLRRIGDQQVDFLEQAEGDDLVFARSMMGPVCSRLFLQNLESPAATKCG